MACNFVFCELCACYPQGRPCLKCELLNLQCQGTCVCCESYRRRMRKQLTSVTGINMNDDIFCKLCACTPGAKSCGKCVVLEYRCGGSCFCCESYRTGCRSQPSTSASHSSQMDTKSNDDFCKECSCKDGDIPCEICSKKDFICPRGCRCCSGKLKREPLKEVESEYVEMSEKIDVGEDLPL